MLGYIGIHGSISKSGNKFKAPLHEYQIYLWDREKDKSFLAEAVMEKHSVASAVSIILPSDGGIANAVA